MNLFEFGIFLATVIAEMLCSRELGRLFAIPEAVAVLPITGVLALSLCIFTRIRPRALVYFSALSAVVCLLSMGLAKAVNLRESIFISPVSAGLTLIAIRGAQLVKRSPKTPDTIKGAQE